jgi:ABC-type Fe3+/spermidine/putrescine transport system ATPase subunit
MSDLVAVMNVGRIEQVDTPRRLYEAPRTQYIAQFVGDANLFWGEVLQAGNRLRLADGTVLHFQATEIRGTHAEVLVRPEKIHIETGDSAAREDNTLSGTVKDVTFLGETSKIVVQAGGQDVVVRVQNSPGTPIFQSGGLVSLSWLITDTVMLW